MNATRTWGAQWGEPRVGALPAFQYAFANPDSPAVIPYLNQNVTLQPPINPMTNRTWANITEWGKYTLGTPEFRADSNFADGYADYFATLEYIAKVDKFFPARLAGPKYFWEFYADFDWVNCPYQAFDYSDHYSEIGVPLIGFISELRGVTWWGNVTRGIASTDVTGVFLPKYGHVDVSVGVYSARDVSEPAYQWMLSHLSALDVTAFSSVTVLPGWTWNFFAHNKGGVAPYTYQWYEGMNPIPGQTSMVLPVTRTAPGVYSFYCRVTDKDGTTTTSNDVTLTVLRWP
jgi:hypothetical protein